MLILGLSGKKQVGKSTTCMFVKELCPDLDVREFGLAEPLKDLVIAGFDIPRECCYGSEEDKNKPLFTWSMIASKLRKKYGKTESDFLTGRELLQLIGTDLFRENFSNDIWVQLCISRITQSNTDVAIISDVRFPNELEAVNRLGGKSIRIYRNTDIGNSITHASEIALDHTPDDDFNYIINNIDISLAELKNEVRIILEKEGVL